jgi:hypothetical protein
MYLLQENIIDSGWLEIENGCVGANWMSESGQMLNLSVGKCTMHANSN